MDFRAPFVKTAAVGGTFPDELDSSSFDASTVVGGTFPDDELASSFDLSSSARMKE
jgi:hypothetical protein